MYKRSFISATPPTAELNCGWTASDETFTCDVFDLFLNKVFSDSQYKNAALLRRLALHQYLDIQGVKKNNTFLVQQYTKVGTYCNVSCMNRFVCNLVTFWA